MKSPVISNSNLQSKLSLINFYGIDFQMRYKKEIIFTSCIGIIFSCITIISLIFLIIKYCIDLFHYSNFRIILNEKDLDRNSSINFTNNPFMLGLSDNKEIPFELNKKLFNIVMMKQKLFPLITENDTFIGVNRINNYIVLDFCNNSQLYYDMSYFSGFDLAKYICPKNDQNIFIKGRYGDIRKGFDIINIYLEKCINSSENNYTCESEETINETLKDKYLSIYFMKEIPDHYDVFNPIKKKLRTDYFSISLYLKKLYLYNFLITDYYTDNGLIFPNKKKFTFGKINNIYMDSIGFEAPNGQLQVIFTCVEYQEEFNRKYNRIFDTFSNLGGMISFLFQIFQYITCYLTKKYFIADLTNNIVNIKNCVIEYSNKGKNKNFISNTSKMDFSNKNFIINGKSSSIKNNIIRMSNIISYNRGVQKIINEYKINKNQKHKFSIFTCILPFFLIKRMKKYTSLNITNEFYENYLSIENILPMIERFPQILIYLKEKFAFNFENEYFKYQDM